MKKKNLVILIALLSIAAFGFLLFHTHVDGNHTHHCFACRLVQQLALIFIPIVTIISVALICRTYVFVSVKNFSSLLLPENLKDRAPPVFA